MTDPQDLTIVFETGKATTANINCLTMHKVWSRFEYIPLSIVLHEIAHRFSFISNKSNNLLLITRAWKTGFCCSSLMS